MAKALAVLGSASDVGKSVIHAGLCRLLANEGLGVAPFKAQNMGNQAGVTTEGLEMPRAQIVQAIACRQAPHVDMGPVLMKPISSAAAEIIVLGRPMGSVEARDYFRDTGRLAEVALAALDRLAERHAVVVLEGAGSPVELNLMDRDFVNLRAARHVGAALLLVVDIDRGGVFSQAKGTLDLLPAEDRRRVLGIIVNRFRGDVSLFGDGVERLEALCGVPVLAVVPHFHHGLDEEDRAIALPINESAPGDMLRAGVVLWPHVANTDDLAPLLSECDVHLTWVTDPRLLAQLDLVVLPGSKATIADLAFLTANRLVGAVHDAAARGAWIVGLCGGYQMLGNTLDDPVGTEGGPQHWTGIGLLPLRTVFAPEKSTQQSAFVSLWPDPGHVVEGYEIHHGSTHALAPAEKLFRGAGAEVGARSGRILGCYLHGLFASDTWRTAFLNEIRRARGLPARPMQPVDVTDVRLDRWAAHLRRHLRPGAWEMMLAALT